MYDPVLIQPMRDELTSIGAKELLDAAAVDAWLASSKGTSLLVINSVCGCAAGMARPGVAMAMQHANRPDHFATVFAGQDKDATARVRANIPQPPSSPAVALFKDGKFLDFLPRGRIEGRSAHQVAKDLTTMFDKHCARV